VLARGAVAGVVQRDLAQGRGESHGTDALEGGMRRLPPDLARAAILAAGARPRVTRVQVLAVLSHILGGATGTTTKQQSHTIRKFSLPLPTEAGGPSSDEISSEGPSINSVG